MARQCTVCQHPKSEEISAALVRGVSSYELAASYGELSNAAIERHRRNGHIQWSLLKAQDAAEIGSADAVSAELKRVYADVQRLKGKAEEQGDLRTALMGVDKALKALELQGKLAQLINAGTTVNIIQQPEFVQVQAVIVDALAPYPAARNRVIEALEAHDE
jgi:hypothetical protein